MKISENYSLERDRVQWILTEHYMGADKDGNDKPKERQTYHSNLKQVASYMVDNKEQHCLDEYIENAERLVNEVAVILSAYQGTENG